jgi:hypothetical protein
MVYVNFIAVIEADLIIAGAIILQLPIRGRRYYYINAFIAQGTHLAAIAMDYGMCRFLVIHIGFSPSNIEK